MRLVRAAEPPSMTVIVDTVFMGLQAFAVAPSDLTKDRIDIVFVTNNYMGIRFGATAYAPTPPALRPGTRMIATIYVHKCVTNITQANITEIK